MNRRSFITMPILVAISLSSAASVARAADKKTLVIDKIVHHNIPSRIVPSFGWALFVQANVGDIEEDFQSRETEEPVETKVNLKIANVGVGEECILKVFIDKNVAFVGTNPSERAKATFKISTMGKKNFRFHDKGKGNYYASAPDDATDVEWRFTVFWHVE